MIKHFAILGSMFSLLLSPKLCGGLVSGYGSEYQEIAGHRVLKVLNRNNTGQDLGGTGAIFEDGSGDYWLASYRELRLYSEALKKWKTFRPDFSANIPYYLVRYISQTKDGRLWFGSVSYGLSPFTPVTVFEAETWKLLDGTIGIGSRTVDFKSKVYSCLPGRHGWVWLVFSDQGQSYVTAFDGEEWLSPISVPFFIAVGIFSGFEDSRGQLWIESGVDIWKLDRSTGRWNKIVKPKQFTSIQQMFEDREGEMWFGDIQNTFARYNANTDTWTCYRLTDYLPAYAKRPNKLLKPYGLGPIVGVTGMYEDKNGAVLFGTNRGLLIFMKAQNKWEFFTFKDHNPTSISTIFEDKTGRVWIATDEGIVIIAP